MINKLVSIKIPVLNALEDMGLDVSKGIPTYTRWAASAEKQIGSYYSFRRKITVLTVNGCTVELPCDASFVQGILVGDLGCDCGDIFNRCFQQALVAGAATTDSFLIIDKPANNQLYTISGLKWQIQDNTIIFSSNLKNQKITVQYLGLETDAGGLPKVVENHVEAISQYIMYRVAVRSRFSPVKMDLADIQLHYREWHNLAACARADDAELSESDRNEIVAMIHDPWIGYGLETGMNNRNDNYNLWIN